MAKLLDPSWEKKKLDYKWKVENSSDLTRLQPLDRYAEARVVERGGVLLLLLLLLLAYSRGVG